MVASVQQSYWRKWSSSDFHPGRRFDAWQEALNQSHLPWALSDYQQKGFEGDMEMGKLHDLQIVRCLCQPCSGYRSAREIAANSTPYYGFLLLFEGYEEVSFGSQSVLLKPGNILFWDSTVPMQFKLHSPINKITLLVPQKRMHEVLPKRNRLAGNVLDWRSGLGAVAVSHVETLLSEISNICAQQSYHVEGITLELLTACLGRTGSASGNAAREELLANIKKYIEQNLEDPTLGPQQLANQFSISLRYLHLLFAEEDATVSRWILQRRLDRCRFALEMPGTGKNITEVAFDWGFSNAAHFSRVFKKHYGMTPREYRQLHLN